MKHLMSKPFILFMLLFSIATQGYAKTATVNNPLTGLAPMLKSSMPAVVNIAIQGEVLVSMNNKEGRGKPSKSLPQQRPRKFTSLGSGVIMNTEKGYIVTNAHVVKNAKTITVTLHDGRHVKAKLIGADPNSDVAVMKIKPTNLQTIPTADSDKVQVGDFVIAIGNPFGLNLNGRNQTATFGIVSALQRNIPDIQNTNRLDSFIQTDAAINPGNSGGALVNIEGKLIGINTAIISPYGGNVGVGLAIPINTVRDVMGQIIKYGSVHRGLMGIFVQHLTPELADALAIPHIQGALITQVNPDSPAERAGLKPGDVIQSINNDMITDATQVKNIVGLLRVGSAVSIKLLRDGKARHVNVRIDDVKQHQEELQAKNPFLYGLALRNFDEESPMHGHIKGVQVVGALENSAGWRAGLRPGDVIISANKNAIATLTQLNKAVKNNKKQLLIRILRGPGALFLIVS